MTHTYDAANRLQQSVDQNGLITTYAWDAAGRLLTTTVDSQVSRVYQYSQDGKLLSADVGGLLTTFAYDGDGRRLLMSVAGEVTTYTLDYARHGQRILLETGPAGSKHYLYGLECIAELVDAGDAETEEWRYYQRDGRGMVRQTTNLNATITLAWAYSPDGAVVLGEKGPVTYLDCGSGAVYDWSTGLVFKNGRYFDPTLGIWITLAGMIIWLSQHSFLQKRVHRIRKRQGQSLFLLTALVILVLSGCSGSQQQPNILEDCEPGTEYIPPLTNPDASLTLKINLVSLHGVTRNWRHDVDYADRVFSQADVSVQAVWKERLSIGETQLILGANNNLDLHPTDLTKPSTEELKPLHGIDNYNRWRSDLEDRLTDSDFSDDLPDWIVNPDRPSSLSEK
jgi:YD repeat-containing protein